MTCDWNRALGDGLSKHITRDYDGGEETRTSEEIQQEIDEVLDALIANARQIYSLFDF